MMNKSGKKIKRKSSRQKISRPKFKIGLSQGMKKNRSLREKIPSTPKIASTTSMLVLIK